ncbi:SDR family oxidoreductase [Curtobacterium flaccumfaciens]|uniref:SDR family oxidoreductase n=1 Tax=Curtobacterium flaccumfaciens TaxID=2035 RepID=UPI003D9A6CA6
MNIIGNTILITGGTSGIGLGLAQRLHESGNRVIVAGRRTALLDAITAENPGITGLELDVADPASIERARETVAVSHPELNVVINNAGIMREENVLDVADVRTAEEQVAINLLGTVRMVYAFAPALVGKPDAAIVNVSSSLAFVPFPSTPTYSATKAALHSFSESLRVQLSKAETGIQVIEIVPPGVRTELMDQQESEHAMPLEDYLTEVMGLLADNPHADEVVVERALPMRRATLDGSYNDMLTMFSNM